MSSAHLLVIPNEQALNEQYPPSCPVRWFPSFGKSKTVHQTTVKCVVIDLQSRESRFYLEGFPDAVPAVELLYAPSCPVWVDGQVKGTVVIGFSDDATPDAILYEIQLEKDTSNGAKITVPRESISFRHCVSNETHAEAETMSPTKMAGKSMVSDDGDIDSRKDSPRRKRLFTDTESDVVSSAEGNALSNKKSCTSADGSGDVIHGKTLAEYLTLPDWLSHDHLTDVIDDDIQKQILSETGCTDIVLISGANLNSSCICVEGVEKRCLNNAMDRLMAILQESVEDHEVERLREHFVRIRKEQNMQEVNSPRKVCATNSSHSPELDKTSLTVDDSLYMDLEGVQLSQQKQQQDGVCVGKAQSISLPGTSPEVDKPSYSFHVPRWAGDVMAMQNNIEQVSSWIEHNVGSKVTFLESDSSSKRGELVLCIEISEWTPVDTYLEAVERGRLAVENLILRHAAPLQKGRLLNYFARQKDETSKDSGRYFVIQRHPDNHRMKCAGVVIPLFSKCEKALISCDTFLCQALKESKCRMQVVGCEDYDEPFVLLYGRSLRKSPFFSKVRKRILQLSKQREAIEAEVESVEDLGTDLCQTFHGGTVEELQIPNWTESLHDVLKEDEEELQQAHFQGATVEIITDQNPIVVRVESEENLDQRVLAVEDWILHKMTRTIPVNGYAPAYRSRLLYHWALQRAKQRKPKNLTVIQGRRYSESNSVYMFCLPLDRNDKTEIEAIFGINGQNVNTLQEHFECSISVQQHAFPFVYVDGLFKENVEGVAQYITTKLEERRRKRGVFIDLM